MTKQKVIEIYISEEYTKRPPGSLTSKRVSIFLRSDKITQRITDAIAKDKRGEVGIFHVELDFMEKHLRR